MNPSLKLLDLNNEKELRFMFETRRHPEVASKLLGQAPATYEQHLEWLKKNHLITRNIYLIVTDEMVGYCQMLFMPSEEAELGWVVHPDHQSKGFGRFSVQALIDEAHKDGRKKLCLYVKKENEKAIGLYESCGFKTMPNDTPDVLLMCI